MDEITLERQQYAISRLIQKDCLFNDVYLEYMIDEMMYKLTICQRPMTKVLQDRTEIARVPTNMWQYIKHYLGFNAEYRIYYLNEHLTFPYLTWPEAIGKHKIYTDYGVDILKGMKINETSNNNTSK